MASSKEYLEFVLEQFSGLDGISHRAMMGEYVIYYRGRVIGGIYDDRFLVKPTPSAAAMMPEAEKELPYEGAGSMLMVDEIDDRDFLRDLILAIYGELPEPKRKKLAGPEGEKAPKRPGRRAKRGAGDAGSQASFLEGEKS